MGESIELFDGRGNQSDATIVQLSRNQCVCKAERVQSVDREPARRIHLAIAMPKPDRSRELIERLTELGVKSVTPLIANRTQRPPSSSLKGKLRRAVIEACKQCGRNELLEIRETCNATDFFETTSSGTRLIAHQGGEHDPATVVESRDEVCAAIGPEGGWSPLEIETAIASGFVAIDLGARIYRIETAAVVIAAVGTTRDKSN